MKTGKANLGFIRTGCLGLGLALLGGCAGEDAQDDDGSECVGAKCDAVDDGSKEARSVCAAVRGNGQLIFAHFASLARIVEHYGLLSGASGGSSASITVFLTESMQTNPALDYVDDAEAANRVALMFKSLQGYVEVLAGTPEAAAFQQLGPVAGRIQEEGIAALAETDIDAARLALLDILTSKDLKALINQEVIDLLTQSPDPAHHARDIINAASGLGSFKVGCGDEEKEMGCNPHAIFIRPGLLDFAALADQVGRIADFYAGYGPSDGEGMETWFSDCATPGRGLNWGGVAELPSGDMNCGERFASLLTTYRKALDGGKFASRADDYIGDELSALISTSMLVGDAVGEFERARVDYLAAEDYSMVVDFDDVRFGYWGAEADLKRVGGNPEGYDDAKTAKFMPLGRVKWREALSYSPAEPGLARALELGKDVSAGGWSDLHPVLALRNLGCEEVIYVTRRGPESGFAQGVAQQLGMTEAQGNALYDLGGESSYALSVAEADAVWCTDWNSIPGTEVARVSDDAYNAPLESSDPFFAEGDGIYDGVVARTGHAGCTPGVSAPAAAE